MHDTTRALTQALEQIAFLAEFRTTGPGKCDSPALNARHATALRLSISIIARKAIAQAQKNVQG